MAMNRSAVVVIVAGAVVAASTATAIVLALAPMRERSVVVKNEDVLSGRTTIIPNQPPEVLGDMKILPFELVNQNGEAVDESIFDGRISLVDFFYTRCPGPCPLMTSELRKIQQALRGTGVQIVSFDVDQTHDTPAELLAYANSNGADLSTWTFLTGDEAQVKRLATDGLGFALEVDESAKQRMADGSLGPNILHPIHFILVGPDRQILALAALGDEKDINLLVEGARRLASGLDGG